MDMHGKILTESEFAAQIKEKQQKKEEAARKKERRKEKNERKKGISHLPQKRKTL